MPRKSPISPSLPVLPVAAAPPLVSAPPWLLPTVHSALSLHTRTSKQYGGFFSFLALFLRFYLLPRQKTGSPPSIPVSPLPRTLLAETQRPSPITTDEPGCDAAKARRRLARPSLGSCNASIRIPRVFAPALHQVEAAKFAVRRPVSLGQRGSHQGALSVCTSDRAHFWRQAGSHTVAGRGPAPETFLAPTAGGCAGLLSRASSRTCHCREGRLSESGERDSESEGERRR